MQQHSRSRRSDFLMILAAVRKGMALLLTGRPTVIRLARGGMHGSCSQAGSTSVAGQPHAIHGLLCTMYSMQRCHGTPHTNACMSTQIMM